ncbi:hypothetical protein EJ03DRAFT_327779 [Teratosphaeria nubilosa]|uniref:Uncharacterized protein n=1 Tax=Teratosphaeria nubilosa TaxID=161662 RepID=A0A6G1L9V4_9PEZI|nr:hypothetical protein EJ03DRAFT_327779 [Teratosphaeria nubilosa]
MFFHRTSCRKRCVKGLEQAIGFLLGYTGLAVNKLHGPTPLRHTCTVDNRRLSEPPLVSLSQSEGLHGSLLVTQPRSSETNQAMTDC